MPALMNIFLGLQIYLMKIFNNAVLYLLYL